MDPYEDIELDEEEGEGDTNHISTIETSVEWTSFREQMAVSMFNSWRNT